MPVPVHLATLFLGVSTNSEVAVTGSVSLSGRVDPVSGMGPKISAAHQYGLKYVALPAGNVHDGRVVDIEPGRYALCARLYASHAACLP